MSGIEHILPKEYQFDTALREVREPLVDTLWDAKEIRNDIIDPVHEFSRPALELWQLSGLLSSLLKVGDESAKDVHVAIYRAMAFGFQVVDDIRRAPIHTLTTTYLSEVFNAEEPGDEVRADVHAYLEANPGLAGLLYSFMPEIDETYDYAHHVETSAGLVFMLCEREQAEIYLKTRGEQLNPESV